MRIIFLINYVSAYIINKIVSYQFLVKFVMQGIKKMIDIEIRKL